MLSHEIELKKKIKQVIQNTTHSEMSYFKKDNYIYLIFCLIDLILFGLMAFTFRNNNLMLILSVSIFFILLLFSAYTLWLFQKFNRIHTFDDTTDKVIEKHISFYNKEYALYLLIKPLIIIAGAFAITAMTDQINGHYVIYNPLIFTMIYIVVYFIIYILNRYFSLYYSETYIIHLRGLKSELEEDYDDIKNPNQMKILILILMLILLLTVGFTFRFLLT